MKRTKCKVCKGKLEGKQTLYCSRKCQGLDQRKPKWINKICGFCRKKFRIGRNNPGQRFCSKRCGYANIRANQAKRSPVRYCKCGKPIKTRSKEFCSVKCHNETQSRKIKGTCGYCHKTFLFRKSARRKFCSWSCGNLGKGPPVRKSGPTTIELKLQKMCASLAINYKPEYPIRKVEGHRYVLDIAIKHLKINVEADGNYYHCNYCCRCKKPRGKNGSCKRCGKAKRNKYQEQTFISDGKRDKFLRDKGWLVLRFTETEIKENYSRVKKKIRIAVRQRRLGLL